VASVTGHPPTVDDAGRLGFAAGEEGVAAVVAALVRAGIPVHAVVPETPTIEQLYFATLEEGTGA